MRAMWKRLLTCLVWAMLMMAALPLALGESTALEVNFQGLVGQADGQWRTVSLTGTFDVMQDGHEVGVITVDEEGSSTVMLASTTNATLLPMMGTMPEGYLIQEAGYSASVTQGRLNSALVMVYADAGLFTLQAEGERTFTLLDEAGEEMMSFTTDENGFYALPEALRSGVYTVHEEPDASGVQTWPDFWLTLTAYRGVEEQIVHVDEAYAQAWQMPQETEAPALAKPTAVPTAEPTAKPTEVVSEAPVTAEPTHGPTATLVPTATPVPVGILTLDVAGDGDAVKYRVLRGDRVVSEGTLSAETGVRVDPMEAGNCLVELTLPEGTVLTGLNDVSIMLEHQAQWQADIAANTENQYHLVLSRTGAVCGAITGVEEDVTIALTGEDDAAEAVLTSGSYAVEGLCPGEYTVSAALPAGEYEGEGWYLTATLDGVIANASVLVESGETVQMPELRRRPSGSLAGVVSDGMGAGAAGVMVLVTDEHGTQAASAWTDESGAWSVSGLEAGVYTVQAEASEGLISSVRQVTLAAHEQAADVNLSVSEPALLTVYVYIDANNNGERGTYERPLAGVNVYVLASDEDAVAAEAVTDEEGKASLSSLPAGQYRLYTVLPDGYGYGKLGANGTPKSSSIMEAEVGTTQTSQPFETAAGAETIVSVGATQMAAISGKCWLDVNGDGIMTDDEPGQAGVKIEMIGLRNGLTYEFITGEDGEYDIGQIRPGSYKLQVTTPEGTGFTKYSKYGGENRSCITTEGKRTSSLTLEMTAGQEMDKRHIGVVTDSVIALQCFLDANYNGLYDEGEAPLAGVEITLYKQSSGTALTKATSDENGLVRLEALRANTYKVNALLPQGCVFTCVTDDPSGNRFVARTGRREYALSNIEIGTGETLSMVVGAVIPGSISGTAYLDNNYSGAMEDGEKVVSGLTVTLTDAEGNAVDTARTTSKGTYTFEGLMPGSYRLELNAKSGYVFTKPGEGNVVVNTSLGSGQSDILTLALGESLSQMDLGMILPGTVSGSVFADGNDNGLWDEDEAGFAGTAVRLMDENGEAASAIVGEDGAFCFDMVMPGRYYLRYELPESSVFAALAEVDGAVSGEGNVGASEWFDFAAGDKVTAPVCGGLTLSSLSGCAFADHNGSGDVDVGEESLSGVILEVTPTRADLSPQSVTTRADGGFAITGLRPGTYLLTVTWPDGYVMSRTAAAHLPLTAGLGTQTVTLQVAMGEQWTDLPLGGAQPGFLRGELWLDENMDGRQDAQEATPAGEQITVIDQTTGAAFTVLTTDENGAFATDSLIPGSYTLVFGPTLRPQSGDCTFSYEDGMLIMRDVPITEGSMTDGLALALVRYTELSGNVWVDVGGTSAPLAGAEVMLTDETGALLQTTTTGETGTYGFEKLMPGDYRIGVTLPEGQLVVQPDDERLNSSALVSMITECQGHTGFSDVIHVQMAQPQRRLNIGSVLPGSVGDLCWLDLNGNGLQDSGEGGIPGVKIELMRGDTVVAETVSDQYGYYLFREVYPAVYTLRVTPPSQVKPTVRNTSYPMIASSLTETEEDIAYAEGVAVISSEHNFSADLGFVLRTEGDYPPGYGEGETQDWSK